MTTFREFFGDTWRDKIVTHRTPTGRITRVKVASLPAEEQLKYNPNRFKRSGADTKMSRSQFDAIRNGDKTRTMDIYIGTKDLDILNKLESGKQVLGTRDSADVVSLFDDDLDVIKLKGVPVTAIKKYLDIPNEDIEIDDLEFTPVEPDATEEELYEIGLFGNGTLFMLDLEPIIDNIEFTIDTDEDDEDDFEELKGRERPAKGEKPKNENHIFSNYYLYENLDNIRYHINHMGTGKTGKSYCLQARLGEDDDGIVGLTDFNESGERVIITMIEVNKNKDLSVAIRMIKHLQDQYPHTELDWKVPDKFMRLKQAMEGYLYVDKKRKVRGEQLQKRHARLSVLHGELERKLDSLRSSGDLESIAKYNKQLDAVEDEMYELEKGM